MSKRIPSKRLWRIKSIREEGPFIDDDGGPYSLVTVTFRWWYRPLAWLHMLRSKRLAWPQR
jgi:hypothetical protein